jgi:response regulator RpfG family c-di-GMP phosphodiesterase
MKVHRAHGSRIRLLVTAGILAAAVAGAAQAGGVLEAMEDSSVDQRFRERGANPPSDVVVVAVDDVTFSELGRQWPFPRSLFGRAVSRIADAGAREVVLDVQFTEPTVPREDMALFDAIDRAGGAVLATSESDGKGRTNVLGGDDNLAQIGAEAGASNLPDGESGGTIRRFTPSIAGLRTLAVVVAERQGRTVRRGEFEPGGSYIDFRGPPGSVPTVSFSSLVRGEVDPRQLRDKIVVVGASAPTIHDQHGTAAAHELMAGPEVQANAIWTLLHGLPLSSAPAWLGLLAVFAVSMAVPLLALRVRAVIAALAAPALGVGYHELAQVVFEAGIVLPVVAPLFGLALAAVATVAASHLLETVERQRIADVNDVLAEQVRARTRDLRETELEIIQRLGQAVESRDEETGDHIGRIGSLCRRLALAAGLSVDEADLLERASAMHDVGKIAIPDRILRKPGPLDPAERATIERHTILGAELLGGSRSALVQAAEEIARSHHERWDGTGYPAGLAGEAIPLAGRICAICDVFDALVSNRPYKTAWPVEEALAEICEQGGRQFDPRLTELFLALDDYAGARRLQRSAAS